ncbi:MAG: DNA polymerase [Archangium sp.]
MRTLIAAASNLLARGFQVVPTDRQSKDGEPVNGLYAVARALHKTLAMKEPDRAIAIIDKNADQRGYPELLAAQLKLLPTLCRTLGFTVVETEDELSLAASYARAAGGDVLLVGIDKRLAQLVNERTWWFDANKDVRYTEEIVHKRFNVPPRQVGEWLALVGDEDQLPGIAGIGAKGASELLIEHGSVADALTKLDDMKGRMKKALEAGREEIPKVLAQAILKTDLPVSLEDIEWKRPDPKSVNALYEELQFRELLHTEPEAKIDVRILRDASSLTAALAKFTQPVTIHGVLEDPAPVLQALSGIAVHDVYVPADSDAWNTLLTWLEDAKVKKSGHDLIPLRVAIARLGRSLNGVVTDSECLSHLTQPSNWAPHDLSTVTKHVLSRALPEDDTELGTGKSRKQWKDLPVERVAEVAALRAQASAQLTEQLFPEVDQALLAEYLALSETCARMELHGLGVDVAELERATAAFAEMEAELEKEITALAGHPFNINSTKQLGEVLYEELKLPIVSRTRTGWSTANEALERIEHAHPIVSLVMRWRTLRRLRDSWLVSLREYVHTDGRVHSRFHVARSFSGHLINSNPDLGRVPGRTPEMNRVRRAFVAQPGWVWMSVDYSQLGLYVLANLTKDPALVEPLKTRSDMHRITAAAVFQKKPEDITLVERQRGKVINFATFAGQGASALALQLGVPASEAKAYLARFDEHYAKVREFQDEQLRLVKEQGFITTIAGRKWPIGGLESLDSQLHSYAERLARRATHEGSVSDVGRKALLEVDRALRERGMKATPVMQILDEVLFEVPKEELAEAARLCADVMRNVYDLELQLVVGVEAGTNWADLEPVVTNKT